VAMGAADSDPLFLNRGLESATPDSKLKLFDFLRDRLIRSIFRSAKMKQLALKFLLYF
jgi:hypothetical protein